ncbi:hypothetical protein H2204_006436 [Knufia peltigerae]|uniref:Myb-like DNA-binding domain-containing protein n=1 Tax=Knufia peltigerae TaxID=1002370 RepID=A0AA39CXK2_9EURO|nr:hypothetical protein H2204_006436 [Knufia peltigerae]
MAPQGSKTGPKSTMDNDAFLARCIKHSKEKINVDWEAFSRDTGMSVGGARNKFRAIMKQLEEAGAAWCARDADGNPITTFTTSPRKTATAGGTKRKADSETKTTAKKIKAEDDGATAATTADADDEGEPPKKKRTRVIREPKVAHVLTPEELAKFCPGAIRPLTQ